MTFTKRILSASALVGVMLGAAACGAAPDPADPRFADGTLPEEATLDDTYPGITNLDPDLVAAVRAASADAAEEGIEFFVNSGWRSIEYQQRLYDQAVQEHGSESAAARWVATPEGSAHTTGEAIDIGYWDAAAWLQENGARYDLCQIFDNEPWHFELREGASADGCPKPYWDASFDPRNSA